MTCIIGLEHNGKVYIGADSAGVSGFMIGAIRQPKVFRVNGFLIGYTTSFRMGQLLQYRLQVNPRKKKQSRDAYMVTVFAEAVRKCLKEGGFARIDSNEESAGSFLVGYQGNLYHCDNDFHVNSYERGFHACGCGREFAIGAMLALDRLPPRKRIKRALKIAAFSSAGVCKPFRIMKL